MLLITILLFSGLAVLFAGLTNVESDDSQKKIAQIAITGDTDNQYFKIGLIALETLDSSRMSMEIIEVDENTAKQGLLSGRISAYAVIPEGFMEAALRGELLPIKFVTTSEADGMEGVLKTAVTSTIEELVLAAQKGVFGLGPAMEEGGIGNQYGSHIDSINIEMIEYILKRDNMYNVEEIVSEDTPTFSEYLFYGISILFMMLIILPYGTILIKSDNSLSKLLYSKGLTPAKQIFVELLSLFLCVFLMLSLIFSSLAILVASVPDIKAISPMLESEIMLFLVKMIPALLSLVAFGILIFEISDNMISGILMMFFLTIALSFAGGCLYPATALPKVMQGFSNFIPIGAARAYVTSTGSEMLIFLGVNLLYVAVFTFFAVKIRQIKFARRG